MWAPASLNIDWPTDSANAPAGAIQGDDGDYTVANGGTFSFSFTVTGNPGDQIEVISWAKGPWVSGTGGDEWSGLQSGGANDDPVVLTLPGACKTPDLDLEAKVVCAPNGIDLTVVNNGTAAGSLTIHYTQDPGPDDSVSTGTLDPGESTTVTVPILENSTYTLTFTGDKGADGTPGTINGTRDCLTPPAPNASVQWECGEANAVVTVSNTGQESVTATILKNNVAVHTGVTVPGQYNVPITGADEDTTVVIKVTFSDSGTTSDKTLNVPVSCDEPEPTIGQPVCADGGVSILLGNVEGEDEATFNITINGVGQTPVVVPAGGSQSYLIPVAEDATVDFSISSGALSQTFDDYKRDCQKPGASLTFSCAAGGVVVNLSNSGTETATITVNGTPHVVAPGATPSFTIAVAEGAGYSITATSNGQTLASTSGTRDCEELSGSVEFDCAEGGVVISVTNTGEISTSISINGGAPIAIAPGNTYDATIPVAEGAAYSVTVTGDGFEESASGTRDCEGGGVGSVNLECAEGGVVVVLTNDGEIPTNVTVNGEVVVVPVGGTSVTVPVAENASYDFDIVIEGITTNVTGTRNCEELDGSVVFECAEGGVVVSVTNNGDVPTSFTINGGDPIEVAVGDTHTETVPVAEGDDYSVTIVGEGLDESTAGTRNCEEPAVVSTELDCAEGGVVVVLSNTGELEATVSVNGEDVTVPAGGTATVIVPVDENADYDFDIVIEGVTTDVTGTRDCEQPGVVSAEVDCAKGGVVVLLTNTGESDTTITVDGDDVVVPAGTTEEAPVEVLVSVDEDAAYDFTVTGDELDEEFNGTLDCETVGGEVVTPTPLPTTGSNTTGLLGLAGALLLAGWSLVTGARRREARLSR
jgi:LPXTG-motif cell wall-anchored protein